MVQVSTLRSTGRGGSRAPKPSPSTIAHIIILVFLINQGHQSIRRRQHVRDKDEDRLFGAELDALADDVDELADGQVRRHEILFLVDRGDVGLFRTLDDADLG